MANHNMLKVDGTNLREMTDDEQMQWFGHNCLLNWANGDSNAPGKLTKVKIGSNKYNLVGSPKDHAWPGGNLSNNQSDGVDTYVGPSEVTQAFLYQRYDSADVMADSDKNTYAPMMWIDRPSGTGLKQMEDSDINNVIDGILGDTLLNEGIGTYRVGHTSPTPVGDWTERFTLLTDTNVQNGTEDVYKVWQRTGMPLSSVDSGTDPVFILDSGQGGSTKYDIREHGPNTWASKWKTRFHERMRETKIGTYQLRLVGDGVPTDPGTWVAKGTITDTIAAEQSADYTSNYEKTFIRYFVNYYESAYETGYITNYDASYTGAYQAAYETTFVRNVFSQYITGVGFTGLIDYISGRQNPNYENRTTNYSSGYSRVGNYQVTGPTWVRYFQRPYLGVGLWPAYQRIRGLYNRYDGISTYTRPGGPNTFFTSTYIGIYPYYYSGSTRWNNAYFVGVFLGPGPMYYLGPGSIGYQGSPVYYYTGPEVTYTRSYTGPARYEGNIYYIRFIGYSGETQQYYQGAYATDYTRNFDNTFASQYVRSYEKYYEAAYQADYAQGYEQTYSGTELTYTNYMGPSRNFYTLGGVQDYVLYVRVA